MGSTPAHSAEPSSALIDPICRHMKGRGSITCTSVNPLSVICSGFDGVINYVGWRIALMGWTTALNMELLGLQHWRKDVKFRTAVFKLWKFG